MTHDLKSALDDFAEAAYADAPPSTIDIGKARADGRRRIAVARLAPIGGGVAVVAACALVMTTLGGTAPAGNGVKAGPAVGPHHTFTGTDPLVSVGTFGWLPDGFKTAGYTTGPSYGDSVTALTPRTAPATPGSSAESQPRLTLTRWASEPRLPEYEHKTEITLKGSKKAYLVVNPASGPGIPDDLSLLWQTESGSWYTLGGDYAIHGDELKALLVKVAEAVHTQEAPVPMPFHIEGLPKNLTQSEADLDDLTVAGQRGVTAGIAYMNGDSTSAPGSYVSIWVTPAGKKAPATPKNSSGRPTPGPVRLSDMPARMAFAGGDATPVCKDSAGLQICVLDNPGTNGVDPLASIGGAKGLLDHVTSLGTDPADWTTHVVN